RVQPGERAAGRALAEEQVLLRVRLALIVDRDRVHPRVSLRHRLDLQIVEREAGAAMDEPRAERLVGVVEVDRVDAEPVDDVAFFELIEIHGSERSCSEERRQKDRSKTHEASGRELKSQSLKVSVRN